jgi:hypothetical protein
MKLFYTTTKWKATQERGGDDFTHEDAKDTTVRRGFAKLPQGMQRLKQILPEATDGIAKMEIPTTVTSANRSVAGRKSACRFLTADRKGNPSAL